MAHGRESHSAAPGWWGTAGSGDTRSGQRADLHLPLTGPNEPTAPGTRLALGLGVRSGEPAPPLPVLGRPGTHMAGPKMLSG